VTAAEPLHAVPDYEPPAVVEVEEDVDFDFDAAWAERKAAQKPPKVRVFGKIYTLPNSLPAKVILFAVKAQKSGRDASSKIEPVEAYDLMASIVGKDNLANILDDGLEMDDMPDLLERCQEIYNRRSGNPQALAVTTGAEVSTSSD
jgi:hypothetical protein